jgi:predicted metal-dependent phosphoesterase TrpH
MGFSDMPPADEAARRGERALTRHHLAGALVASGKARRFTEAMERYAGPQAGLVPALTLSAGEGIAAAHAAGALVSWAHPSDEQLRRWLKALTRLGLDAIEACRPGLGPLVRGRMMRAAHDHGLLVTGGSDWHGWGGSVGAFAFPWREAEPLLRRLDRGRDMASAPMLA